MKTLTQHIPQESIKKNWQISNPNKTYYNKQNRP